MTYDNSEPKTQLKGILITVSVVIWSSMVVYAFNPSTQEAEAADFCEVYANLVYMTSSRTAGVTK